MWPLRLLSKNKSFFIATSAPKLLVLSNKKSEFPIYIFLAGYNQSSVIVDQFNARDIFAVGCLRSN